MFIENFEKNVKKMSKNELVDFIVNATPLIKRYLKEKKFLDDKYLQSDVVLILWNTFSCFKNSDCSSSFSSNIYNLYKVKNTLVDFILNSETKDLPFDKFEFSTLFLRSNDVFVENENNSTNLIFESFRKSISDNNLLFFKNTPKFIFNKYFSEEAFYVFSKDLKISNECILKNDLKLSETYFYDYLVSTDFLLNDLDHLEIKKVLNYFLNDNEDNYKNFLYSLNQLNILFDSSSECFNVIKINKFSINKIFFAFMEILESKDSSFVIKSLGLKIENNKSLDIECYSFNVFWLSSNIKYYFPKYFSFFDYYTEKAILEIVDQVNSYDEFDFSCGFLLQQPEFYKKFIYLLDSGDIKECYLRNVFGFEKLPYDLKLKLLPHADKFSFFDEEVKCNFFNLFKNNIYFVKFSDLIFKLEGSSYYELYFYFTNIFDVNLNKKEKNEDIVLQTTLFLDYLNENSKELFYFKFKNVKLDGKIVPKEEPFKLKEYAIDKLVSYFSSSL